MNTPETDCWLDPLIHFPIQIDRANRTLESRESYYNRHRFFYLSFPCAAAVTVGVSSRLRLNEPESSIHFDGPPRETPRI